ncbi:hypothetical protein MKK68_02305 [Methylobacterium sp. E-016]|uniref:hypothetical protein n=1 Tax=Methylobacterium sp. E-016 TaxID=2836556 RepID=UPI001FB8CFD7|nr:hypothetical protein [Methylobacterium sp. E-016]MCJ2074492.1 hypothetical protein [Methylobacterium sp. E-016]
MPENDREVFDRITEGDAEPVEDFLTYAIFAYQRREWVRHYIDRNGDMPAPNDIDTWIGNLTNYDFDQMRTRAATVFDLAARTYMAPDVEAAREDGLRDALLREVRGATDLQKSELGAAVATVKAAGSFWTQLGVALLTAIIAPLIIGGVIVFALAFSDRFPSIREIAHGAAPAVVGDKPSEAKNAKPVEAAPGSRP